MEGREIDVVEGVVERKLGQDHVVADRAVDRRDARRIVVQVEPGSKIDQDREHQRGEDQRLDLRGCVGRLISRLAPNAPSRIRPQPTSALKRAGTRMPRNGTR